jgi:hypothetical protein
MTSMILNLIFQNTLDFLILVGGILGIGFILGTVENVANRQAFHAFGKKGILATAWLGTPIHELSHLFMCFVFHHKVERVKLFQFKANDGTLGYVIHRFNPGSVYQMVGNFFIGIAPLFGGIAAIFGALALLNPASFNDCINLVETAIRQADGAHAFVFLELQTIVQLVHLLFTWKNMTHPTFWLFVYISICIASHISLSPQDVKGAVSGLFALFILLFIINAAAAFFEIRGLNLATLLFKWNLYLAGTAGLALLFSMCHLLICLGVVYMKRLFSHVGSSQYRDQRFF